MKENEGRREGGSEEGRKEGKEGWREERQVGREGKGGRVKGRKVGGRR